MWIYLTYVGLKLFLALIVVGLAAKALKNFIGLIDSACKIEDERTDKAISLSLPLIVAVIGASILCIHLDNDMLLAEIISNIYNLGIEKVKEIINLYQGGSNE